MSSKKTPRIQIEIYTDGACMGNPGPGGWAAVRVSCGRYEEFGGSAERTTNNRMEMTAAIEGLRRVEPCADIHVVTDSRYLHDGISKWIHGWKRNGWKKADGGDVLNRDLWEELDRFCSRPGVRVTWEHVRGHAGHALNERCDKIATGFARGETPELRSGDGSWMRGMGDEPALAEGLEYPLYLSLAEGELRVHLDWPECEGWVRGAKGAKYKKVRSGGELLAVLEKWCVSAEEAKRLGLGLRARRNAPALA